MYALLLTLHSLFRWIFLLLLLYAVYQAWRGSISYKPFRKLDNTIRVVTVTAAHIQLTIGIILYFASPIISYFLHNFKEAVHQRDIRFFGMEHITLMILAVTFITVGSSSAKRKTTDQQKFKTIAIWFSIALFLILISIPWPFSPFTSRPYFRSF